MCKFPFEDLTPAVLEFDQDVGTGSLAEFLQSADKLGGEIAEHARLVQKAFTWEYLFP